MSRLTAPQELSLARIRVGDFILVEPASSLVVPHLMLVHSISSTSRDQFRVTVKVKYELDPANLFDYQRYGTWNLECMSYNYTDSNTLEDLVNPSDVLTLAPSVEMLKEKFMGGICLYANCVEGLVHKSPITVNDVHFREGEMRAGKEVWTLCPYCMGGELQMRHECLVTVSALLASVPDSERMLIALQSSQRGRYRAEVLVDHLAKLNAKRAELGYEELAQDVDLVVLDGQQAPQAVDATSRPPSPSTDPPAELHRPARRFRVPRPVQSRHSSRHSASHWPEGPRISSHSFKWFQNARERVLNDVCNICQQDYQEGERIADLACQHFYHERCLQDCFEAQRGERKRESCPLCRRRVVT